MGPSPFSSMMAALFCAAQHARAGKEHRNRSLRCLLLTFKAASKEILRAILLVSSSPG